MRKLRDHSLSLVFLGMFLVALVGQAIAGHAEYNNEQIAHMSETVSFWRYVVSSEYGQAVMENWQSEYLQFTTFIVLTVWLIQKGSPESKKPDEAGPGSDKSARRSWIRENSLLLVMGSIWTGTWFAQWTSWGLIVDIER